jgi:actin related protein 2/3 complex subunit 3
MNAFFPRNNTFSLADANADDIIDEALDLFRANCLFRNFEIKGNADRVLIYLILFISQCLGSLNKLTPQGEALKSLNTLALSNFSIPSDPAFPLNAMYQAPTDKFQTGNIQGRCR